MKSLLLLLYHTYTIWKIIKLNIELVILLSIMVLAIISFTLELLPLEVTALASIALLVASGILTIEEAISGFSNKAVITIGAIFIISRSLVKTGILEVFADYLYRLTGNNKWFTIFIFLFTISNFFL